MPSAIRVRTSEGWQDVALSGPPGLQGIAGVQGIPGIQGVQGPTTKPVAYHSTGPKYGSGGTIGGSYWVDAQSSGRTLPFTTPAYPTRGFVEASTRWDAASAQWSWFMSGVEFYINAPQADYGPKVSRPDIGFYYGRNIWKAYSGSATWISPYVMFWVDLAASTQYEFCHAAYGGGFSWYWDPSMALNTISVALYNRTGT